MEINFKKRAFQGAALVIFGYGASQAIRLGGNLILTRLLAPELFGIMALAFAFINGLYFFSDIGLGPGIIRSPRANDPVFLNTAWTMQILRGIVLYIFVLTILFPVAKIYENPIFIWVLPILGLNCIISGFNSTSIHTLNKNILLGKLTVMDISVQLIGLLCMVVIAYFYRNIWALVVGVLVTATLTTIWSHCLDLKFRNQFVLEKAAINELFNFGKWIFFSTAMMFLATQSDRFLLGKIFPLAFFGVYNIAVIFAELPKQVVTRLSERVIFPLISNFSHLARHELRQKILIKRKLLLIPLAILVALLASFGDILIMHLYDMRYQEAGWMLPILALGMWPLILYITISRSLYVIGKPQWPAYGNFIKFFYMVTCVPVFYMIFGKLGAVFAVAMNDIPAYFVFNYGLRREKLSGLRQDVLMTLFLLGIICLFLTFRFYIGIGFPGKTVFPSH